MTTASSVLLATRQGGTFRFDAGSLCLELLLTGGEGERARYELLHAPADLAPWLARSSLAIRVEEPGPADLAAARALREAIWQVATSLAAGRRPSGADLAVVNRVAAESPLAPRLDEGGVPRRSWATPARAAQALSTIARDAVDLFGGARARRVRQCEGATCALVFLDTSRPGSRRWCSMERCGNWAKVRAYRARGRREPLDSAAGEADDPADPRA